MGTISRPQAFDGSAGVSKVLFRQAFRQLAGGVTVITTGAGDERTGYTATAVSSFSDEPPTLVISVNTTSSSFGVIEKSKAFGVNILKSAQREIAARFTGWQGAKGPARYENAVWTQGGTGTSLLVGALATFDCQVDDIFVRHSHALIIGRIVGITLEGEDTALVYWRGGYEQLGWSAEEIDKVSGSRSPEAANAR